jgi:CheY-like chemotaxis protein
MMNRTQSLGPPPVRVVVVEDDEDDRLLLTRQLKKSAIDSHVKFFTDGEQALDFLSTLPPRSPSPSSSPSSWTLICRA